MNCSSYFLQLESKGLKRRYYGRTSMDFLDRYTRIPTPMPTARSWLAAVIIDNQIMAIGGGNCITKIPCANNKTLTR